MTAPDARNALPTPQLLPLPPVSDLTGQVAPVSLSTVATLLRGLNREQRSAVTHREGPLLVVAGPGTGKTEVITRRVAWLVATKRARPSQILALTFTDKAAEEMQARVDVLVPYGQADAAIHTFHAFGDRLLRDFAFEIGLPSDPRVVTRPEAVMLLRERLFELGLERYRPLGDPTRFLSALVDLFHRAKDEDVSPDQYRAYAERLWSEAGGVPELLEEANRQRELAGAYGRYQAMLAEGGCLDFGDQVAAAVRLLREHPAVREEVAQRYRYVLVDEFQDTNPSQLALLELVASRHGNVCAVGDDDQSIYTFRGAALDNLLGFAARQPGLRQVVLRRNHRSTTPILDAAHRLIRHNDPDRLEARAGLDKRLKAQRRRRAPIPVRHIRYADPEAEADGVAAAIAQRIRAGAAPRDVAVLVRTNADAEPFLRSLDVAGVPWRFSGASGLYARPEVRDLLCFLRAVADPESTVDVYGLATADPYRLGGRDLTAMVEMARRKHRSLWSLLEELDTQPGLLRLADDTRRRASALVADLRAAIDLAHRLSAGEVLYDHLKRSGKLARWARAETQGDDEALQNVARFFTIVRTQSTLLRDARVTFVARHMQALIDAGEDPATAEADGSTDAVSVLTVHRAKGLEFPVVYLVGLVEGRFPRRARRDPLRFPVALTAGAGAPVDEDGASEERRLCYVAMTRARDELVLTWSRHSRDGRLQRPSRFLAEAVDLPPATPADDPLTGAPGEGLAILPSTSTPAVPSVGTARQPGRADPSAPFSFSQLDAYLSCPLKYKLRHVIGLPTPAHHALTYGNALHQAVAAFNSARRRGEVLSEEALFEVLDAHWTSDGFLSRSHEEARYAQGREALRRFRDGELAGVPTATGVEKEFSFQLGPDRIRGRFDRVDGSGEETVITDYKSSDVRDQKRADEKARESLQLAIYALAHEAQTGTLPAAVQLHFLDSGVVGRAPVTPQRLSRTRDRIERVTERIREGDFEPSPDQITCGMCPYREICPSAAG